MISFNKIRRHILALATLCVLTTAAAVAQTPKFEIQSPLVVAQGEQFRIEFVVTLKEGEESELTVPPTFSGSINVMAGPTKSVGVFMSNMNGVTSSHATNTYTYWVQAVGLGKLNVSAATVNVGGKPYSTKATIIESMANDAVGGSTTGQQSGSNTPSSRSSAQDNSKLATDDILLRMELSRNEVYKGEALVATLKLYTRVNIAGISSPKYPAFNGFWTQDLDIAAEQPRREVVGGKEYQAQILRRWLLYPQRVGVLDIEQTEFTATAQLITQMEQGNSPFDLFYGGGSQVRNVEKKLASPALKITVKELPKPQPAGFAGAVGRFTISAALSGTTFSANKAGSLVVKLQGTGDFPLIESPKLTLPAAFEQYDVKTSESITNTVGGTIGERTYEYPFVARAEGTYTIPSIEIPYFDPTTSKYATLSSGEFTVEIIRDNNSNSQGSMPMISGVTKEDLKMLGQDIRFIRVGDANLSSREGLLLWSWRWFALVLLLAAAFALLLFFMKKRIAARADVARQKTKKANKVALRRLKRARTYMAAGDENHFFEEILRALWGYMGDKLLIDVANLTKERVRGELNERGFPPERVDEFLSLVAECEFSQYSPAAGIKMDKAYAASLDLMDRFESKNF